MPELVDAGLSPLARGILHITRNTRDYCRFIPAGAGSTDKSRHRRTAAAVYPRWRGEYANNQHQIQPFPGLSPLARGILQIYPANSRSVRFIPAGAGNTGVEPEIIGKKSVYPRWRGEYAHASTRHIKSCGLSPLARGIRFRVLTIPDPLRFIPAGAGNTQAFQPSANPFSVYPRWRGEYLMATALAVALNGLSPLARGIPR